MGWLKFGDKSKEDPFEGTAMGSSKPRCYETHPALKLGNGTVYGGSASWPVHKADVYVALQQGSSCGCTSDPWDEQKVVEVHFGITDMQPPTNVPRFKKMITWLAEQLNAGKTVHIGCIGGHGRTGTVLSALVAEMTGKKNAIQWVRKHYCVKAVESRAQVQFLMKHYGVEKATGYKEGLFSHGSSKGVSSAISSAGYSKETGAIERYDARSTALPFKDWGKPGAEQPRLVGKSGSRRTVLETNVVRQIIPENVSKGTRTFQPMASPRCIWRARNAGKSDEGDTIQ